MLRSARDSDEQAKTHASAGDLSAQMAAGCWVEVEGYMLPVAGRAIVGEK